ncbi:MAG: T9SS type A sorting domain-containing protein, partial [Bacteroides sp.]
KLTSLTAGTQDIFATKKFTVTEAVTVKAVFKKKENNGGGNNGGNNGGGNNGGSWQPQTPKAVEDAVLASLAVAPNPFTAQLRIENPEGVAVRYELVNASGLVVRSGAFSATEVFVNTEALPTGIYFVRIEAQNGAKGVVKVVKY